MILYRVHAKRRLLSDPIILPYLGHAMTKTFRKPGKKGYLILSPSSNDKRPDRKDSGAVHIPDMEVLCCSTCEIKEDIGTTGN